LCSYVEGNDGRDDESGRATHYVEGDHMTTIMGINTPDSDREIAGGYFGGKK